MHSYTKKFVRDPHSSFQCQRSESQRIVDHGKGLTALQKACRDGDVETVNSFLQEGLTEEHILRKDACGETALHDSILEGLEQIQIQT